MPRLHEGLLALLAPPCAWSSRRPVCGHLWSASDYIPQPSLHPLQRPQGHSGWEKQKPRPVLAASHGSAVHPPAKSKVHPPVYDYKSQEEERSDVGLEDEEREGGSREQETAEELVSRRRALAKQKLPEKSADLRPSQDGRGRGRESQQQSEETKRRIAARMRAIHQQAAHRRKISEALIGRKYICSICGQEGHNKRGCPQAEENAQVMEEEVTSDEEEAVPTPKGRTKKMKGIPYQDLVAMQEQRRIERRQKHRDRPKTHYKGLTWHVNQSGKGTWHVQVWTGKTNKSVGYYEDEDEAALEYDKAVLELRGPSAQLNLPQRRPSKPAEETSTVQMPVSTDEEIALAVKSIVTAFQAGSRRQRIEYLLPLAADGEAGGVRQEFKVARNLVEATLLQLKDLPEFKNEKLAAVVFCTADCLTQLRNLDGGELGDRLVLVFNPQWQIGGQILSDFGFGQRRRDAEEFVKSFQDVFFMQQRRVMGDSIRILKSYGSKWQVHYIWPNRKGDLLVSSEEEPPTYQRLLSLLQAVPGSKSSRSWVERVLTPDWLPGSSMPVDPDRLSSSASQSTGPQGMAVVRTDDQAAPIKEASASESFQELQENLAGMSSSPVTDSPEENPVESPQTLAAAAALDQAAVAPLLKELPEDEQDDSRHSGASKDYEREAQSRLERFGNGETVRSFQMDPLNNMPQWQKQLLSNSFGKDRGDEERLEKERKNGRIQERKMKLAAEFARRMKSADEEKR